MVGVGGIPRIRLPVVVILAAGLFLLLGCRSPGAILGSVPHGAVEPEAPVATAIAVAPVLDVPAPTAVPAPVSEDPVRPASLTVSGGADSANDAFDGDSETLWTSGGPPPQWFTLTLDGYYRVDRLELEVAQTPAGQTSHEIWLGNASGEMVLAQRFENTWTEDGETLTITFDPAAVTNRIQIRTTDGPSFVAWREVRVFGRPSDVGVAGTVGVGPAASTPTSVTWPKVSLSGRFNQPVQVTNAGDGSGRLFVSERTGRIRIIKDSTLLEQPFLDISDRVRCCDGEQGFFSVAFPPDFARTRHFYVSYTTARTGGQYSDVGDTVIARYRLGANANVADPASEEILLIIPQPAAVHNGGHLAFGPKDGYLYFGSGDGGVAGDPDNSAQRLDTLLGKILRLDVESGAVPYAIPPTNPFAHTAGARGEIWAIGLRNPWQFAFDRQTGDLFIADVGENQYEEINFQPAASKGGENYGWPLLEGNHCVRSANCDVVGYSMPVAEYDHGQGCAAIGGTVYRGPEPQMRGVYFYTDLCSGRIWGLQRTGGAWQNSLLDDERFSFSSIGEDEAGNLFLTDFAHGALLRLLPRR